jgi:chromosome segregation ATPase
MRATPTLAFAAALAAAGCASGPPTVLDADYGRLRPDQASSVDGARQELARAHQELAAAKAANGDAAKERQASDKERELAAKDLDRAEKRVEAAAAREQYVKTLVEARKAAEDAAQRRIDLYDAKVELLKLQSLEQAKLQPSKAYDSKAFYGRVADAQKKLDDAQDGVKKLDRDASDGRRRWEDLARKVPAALE